MIFQVAKRFHSFRVVKKFWWYFLCQAITIDKSFSVEVSESNWPIFSMYNCCYHEQCPVLFRIFSANDLLVIYYIVDCIVSCHAWWYRLLSSIILRRWSWILKTKHHCFGSCTNSSCRKGMLVGLNVHVQSWSTSCVKIMDSQKIDTVDRILHSNQFHYAPFRWCIQENL